MFHQKKENSKSKKSTVDFATAQKIFDKAKVIYRHKNEAEHKAVETQEKGNLEENLEASLAEI